MRISGRKKLIANSIKKVIVSAILSILVLASITLYTYKPVYKVFVDGVEKGYISSRKHFESVINKYIVNGDMNNVAYVVLNSEIDYELMLLKKDEPLNESEIIALVESNCDIYRKVYAVKDGEDEKCTVETYEEAEEIIALIDEKQKNFTKQSIFEIEEKIVLDYEKPESIEVAVNDIYKELKAENDAIVSKRVTATAVKTVDPEILNALKESTIDINFTKPLDKCVITSRFGWRSLGYHYGLDFGATVGTEIRACADGIVTYSAWCGTYGYLVKIQHANNYETYYGHCSRLIANVGDEVKQGDLIAYVGNTGRSTGPHLHVEVRYDGTPLDPEKFIILK